MTNIFSPAKNSTFGSKALRALAFSLLVSACAFLTSGSAFAATITQWQFNTVTAAPFNSPPPDVGSGTATPLGMTNSYTNSTGPNTPTGSGTFTFGGTQTTGNTTNCDVASNGSPVDPFNSNLSSWRIRSSANGNGWALQAPERTQGVQFSASTVGYTNVTFSADWNTTAQAVRDLQLQYTIDGTNWINIGSIFSAASGGGWLQVTQDFSAVSGVSNNASFGVRMVSVYNQALSPFPNYSNTTGALYNNNSGNWRFTQVTFSGTNTGKSAPVIANFSPNLSYIANQQTVTVAPNATISSPLANFGSGNLTITITSNGNVSMGQDVLGIANVGTGSGQIGVSGSNVSYGGTTIGTVAGGTFPAALVVTFNTSATPTAAQALLENVTYKNAGSPATLAVRTVQAIVDDGSGTLATSAPVTLTINVANGPVAANDSYTALPNTTLNVPAASGLFANDNGFGQPLQLIVNSNPAHGTVTINGGDGSFSYTPASNFTGTDTFTYTVSNAVQLWKTKLPSLGVVGGVNITGGGYGSSLCPVPGSTDEYYGLTDRGPNVAGPNGSKIQPLPAFNPAIGKFKFLSNGTAVLEAVIGMKDSNNVPYTGRANSTANTGETITDINGNVIQPDTTGYDPEGLAALADGTFWVSDEYGPFITHFDATGKQIGRLSPYDSSLPQELAVRVPNKGMEGLTVTPDGSMLVGIMQGALQQPDLSGAAKTDPTKILMLRIVTYNLTGPNAGAVHEYAYLMDGAFGSSELTAVTNTKFIVNERDGKYAPASTKKFFTIDISTATDIGPAASVAGATYSATTAGGGLMVGGQSLELLLSPGGNPLSKAAATTALANANIIPVNKTVTPALDLINVLVSLDSQGRFFSHDKVEGLAVLNGGHKLIVSNDSDFGITDSISTVPPFALTLKASPTTGVQDDGEFLLVNLDQLPTAPATATVTITVAGTVFNAVAAGDVTSSDVILWTRVQSAVATSVTAQLATDASFASFQSFIGTTDTNQDNTAKINPTGLKAGTRYFYRFVGPNGELSNTGTFKTAPAADVKAPVHFGFSGDCDGQWRPFPSVADIGTQQFDFFEFCGDTMYENAISPAFGTAPASAIVTDPDTSLTQCLADLRRKYLENISTVTTNGNASLKNFFASQANYTLLDNHELCSNIPLSGAAKNRGRYQCGGAPTGTYDNTVVGNDINLAGPWTNKLPGFTTCIQAFKNYQPIRETIVSAPSDPRTDGTQQLYRAQQWGQNLLFIHTDDRSYADQRPSAVTDARATNASRTRLGATQLAWLKAQLLAAQTSGVTWKFVAVSDPIDQIGPMNGGSLTGTNSNLTNTDGAKSWMGAYRYERNDILKYIADNKILNVVFIATDDHTNRVNELLYSPDPTQLSVQTAYVTVPNCFSVVCGPIGASGPENFTDHTTTTLQSMATAYAAAQTAAGVNPCGLDPHYPGLHDVVREGDANADINRTAFDFFSPDTFNYTTFDISGDGKTLTVKTLGINSYLPNTFPEASATGAVRQILSFQVDANVTPPIAFSAVAAGDVTSSDVILWTRAIDNRVQGTSSVVPVTVTVAKDSSLTNGVITMNGTTDATQDFTVKLNVTGLAAGTRYYYQFSASGGYASNVGTFKTAPSTSQKAAIRFGFSGDCDGQWRPFPSVADIGTQQFDFFEFCGDTMYENAISPAVTGGAVASAIVTDPDTSLSQCLADLRRKYLENINPVNGNGQYSLKNFFASQANYTMLDNHELCSNIPLAAAAKSRGRYQCGGAPTGTYDNTVVGNDINLAGPWTNKLPGFTTCIQAFKNYQPIRETIVSAPSDPRTDGTQQLYRAQQWGQNLLFIHTDDRSYADQRPSAVTDVRATNASRTRLGATQLAWLKAQLLAAQTSGVTWKFVAVSDPIDQIGPMNGGSLTGTNSNLTNTDGAKSWMGAYRYERNDILKYIADNKILNVVFIATDDHTNRVNELLYSPDSTQLSVQSAYTVVPGCFSVVCGPIGASGPENFTDHATTTIQGLATAYASAQKNASVHPCGLDPAYPGLHNVTREGDATADSTRTAFDFFSPDTFNYTTFDISADGKTLTVATLGINSYQPNTFPEASATGAVRQILSFQVDAYVNPVSLVTAPASGGVNSAIPLTITPSLVQAQFQPTLSILVSNLPTGATLSAGTVSNGTYTLTAAQLNGLTITAPNAGTTTLNVTANALDGSGKAVGSASRTLALTVTANVAPVASNGSIAVTGIQPGSGTLIATDAENEPLTFVIVTNGTSGVATITNAATGAFTYKANANVAGADSFTFKASDANGVSNTATITVGILLDSVANPVTISASNAVGVQGKAIPLNVSAALTNQSTQYTISVAISNLPAGAVLSAGTLSNNVYTLTKAQLDGLTVTAANAGTTTVTYTATALNSSNVSVGSASTAATLTVAANKAPVALNGSILVTGTTPATGTLNALDAESDALTFQIVANGTSGNAVITNAATGAYTYTANGNVNGGDSFTFTAKDAFGTSNTATISVAMQQFVGKPTAVLGSILPGFIAPAAVAFDGTNSGLNITSYQWDFGDGTTGVGPAPVHTYSNVGTYTVSLTVTNSAGTSDPVTTQVIVAEAAFDGKFSKTGASTFSYTLKLPADIPVGATASLGIGGFNVSFNGVSAGAKLKASAGTLKVTGSTLAFQLKANAAQLFGTPLPASGSQTITVNYNGHSFVETVQFSKKGTTTSFK